MSIPYIYNRTITAGSASGETEQGIAIANASIVRRFATSDWTWLRLGIRFRFTPSSSAVSSSFPVGYPRFYVGLCNGTDNIPGDAVVNQFLGCGIYALTPNYVAGGYIDPVETGYSFNVASASYESSSNIHLTAGVGFGGTYFIARLTSSLDATFIDFIKTGSFGFITGSYKMYAFTRNLNTTNRFDYYDIDVFTTDIQAAVPSHAGYAYNGPHTASMPLTYTTSPLNAVCIHWDRTDPILEINDIYIVKMA